MRCTGTLSCRRRCRYLLYLFLLILCIILFIDFAFHFCISHFSFHFSVLYFVLLFIQFSILTNPDSPFFPNQPTNLPPWRSALSAYSCRSAHSILLSSFWMSPAYPLRFLPTPVPRTSPSQHNIPYQLSLRHNMHKELQMLSSRSKRTIEVPFENRELASSLF